jgi:hypothetical protein
MDLSSNHTIMLSPVNRMACRIYHCFPPGARPKNNIVAMATVLKTIKAMAMAASR